MTVLSDGTCAVYTSFSKEPSASAGEPSVTIGSGRWDFPLSAQGNGVDISPAIPTRDSGSLSINSSLATMAVSHTHRAGFRERISVSGAVEIWPAHTTPVPCAIIGVQHLYHSTSQGTSTGFRIIYWTRWKGCNLTLLSTSIKKGFLSQLG